MASGTSGASKTTFYRNAPTVGASSTNAVEGNSGRFGASPTSTTHSFRSSNRLRGGLDSGTGTSNSIPPAPALPSSLMTRNSDFRVGTSSSSAYMGGGTGMNAEPLADLEETSRPFATPEDFENMVGDLRRTFIGWLKKTEGELRRERESLREDRTTFEEDKKKQWHAFLTEKQAQYEKIQEERRRASADIAATMKQIAVEREDARQRVVEERDKLEREREVWKKQSMIEKEKFMEEYEAFEEERRKIVDANIAVQTVVDLNVGGVVFETSRLTLVQQPGSFLEGLLSGRHNVPRDRAGRIFIDRDSELFRTLLQFLRNPSVPPCPRDAAESGAITAEAAYYGLKFFPFPLVFAIAGHNGVDHIASVEVLDVGEQCWRPCAPLATPRTYFGATSQLGRLYAFGGQNFEYKALCDAEAYDILRDTWMPAPSLGIPRRNTCGVSLGQRVFAIGGFDGAGILSSVEAYDPRMKNWMEVEHLTTPRSSACCAPIGDSIYVFGGTSGERLRTVERFDARTNKWEEMRSGMIEVRSAACAAAIHNSVYVIGGTDSAHRVHNSIESLDGHLEKWMFRRNLPGSRMDAGCTVVSDSIMVTGGQDEDVITSSLFYRPELDEWRDGKENVNLLCTQIVDAGPPMLFPRYGHALLTANI